MLNHDPGSSIGSASDGGGLRSLLRNVLIVAVVGMLAALALSFRSEVSQTPGMVQDERTLDRKRAEAPADQELRDDEQAYGDESYEGESSGKEAYDEERGDETSEALISEIMIRKDASGHFLLKARVEGVAIRFLVDTGASDVVLSPEDARRLNINSSDLDFSLEYQTANGTVRAAPVTLNDFRIGQLELYDLEASVNEVPMGISLLGMSFLERLDSYAVEGDTLILRW